MKMKMIWRTEEPNQKEEEEEEWYGKHKSEEEKQRFRECRTIWKIEGGSEGAKLKIEKEEFAEADEEEEV